MAFEAKKLDATLINNNTAYQEGDALQPSAINYMVEGILHNQENGGGSGLTEEEKAKLDKIVIDGNGDKYLNDKGEYKEVASGSNVTVDKELSLESENPVQNKVITEALNGKVGSTDYATANKAGVVKQGSGFYMGSDGTLQLNKTATNWSQDTLTTNMSGASNIAVMAFSIPKMVKISLVNPDLSKNEVTKANWTEEEKALARATIGATRLYKHTITIPFSEDSEMPTYEDSIVIKFFSLGKNLISSTTGFRVDVNELQIDDYANNYIVSSPLIGANSSVNGDTAKQMTVKYAEDGASKGFWYYLAWSELGLDIASIETANIIEVIEDL